MPHRYQSQPFLTFGRLQILAFTLGLLTVGLISTQPQDANDFWLQAKVGEWIAQQGEIPRTLLFPFTEARDLPFNAHEWLPSLMFHWALYLFGEAALPWLLGLLGLFFFGLMYQLALLRAPGEVGLALLCALLALICENFRHLMRPELLSLLLCGAFLYNLECLLQQPAWNRWGVAILLSALWANVHGSFVLAPLLIGMYAAGAWLDCWRFGAGSVPSHMAAKASSLVGLSVLCALALLATPFGWSLIVFALEFPQTAYVRENIIEWFPLSDSRLYRIHGVLIGVGFGVTLLLGSLWQWRRLRSRDLLLLMLVALLSWRANRFLVYLSFCVALVLPSLAQVAALQRYRLALLWLACGLCCSVMLYASQFGNVNGNFPFRSRAWGQLGEPMRQVLASPLLSGNVYCSYEFGAELVYRAYPRLKPSIDSRIDSYGEDYFNRHEGLLRDAALMAAFVERYQVRLMLLTLGDFVTLRDHRVLSTQNWQLVAQDGQAVLLLKK